MNLVRNNQCAAFITDISDLRKFLFRPYTSARVMRIAQNQQFTSLHIFAETVEVYMILAIFQYQRTEHDFALILLCYQKERMINRRHDHYFISFLRETMDGKSQSTHNAGSKCQHIFANRPPVAFFQPVNDRLRPFLAGKSISEHFVFQTFLQSIYHKRSRTEIHIGHPHRNQVIASPTTFHGIPFYGIRTFTVYYFIKIIVHTA